MFAVMCITVCKPEAKGQGIAIRAKVEQKGRLIILLMENMFGPGIKIMWEEQLALLIL